MIQKQLWTLIWLCCFWVTRADEWDSDLQMFLFCMLDLIKLERFLSSRTAVCSSQVWLSCKQVLVECSWFSLRLLGPSLMHRIH